MKTSNLEMNPLHDASPEDAIGMLIIDHNGSPTCLRTSNA